MFIPPKNVLIILHIGQAKKFERACALRPFSVENWEDRTDLTTSSCRNHCKTVACTSLSYFKILLEKGLFLFLFFYSFRICIYGSRFYFFFIIYIFFAFALLWLIRPCNLSKLVHSLFLRVIKVLHQRFFLSFFSFISISQTNLTSWFLS
jgi:hypothetical protein